MKNLIPRWFLAAGAAMAAVLVLLPPGSDADEADASQAITPPLLLVPADLVTADSGTVSQGIRVTGTLDPRQRSTVNARVAAVVDDVLVREGERVRRGQVLLRQNSADIAAQLRQAEAQLTSAEVQLELTEGLEKRKTDLYHKNYLSEIDWAEAKGDTKVKASLVAVQQANVAIARKALADTIIRAPMDGMIAERLVEPGTNVMPGQALMTLVDLAQLELAADIPARDITRVRIGNKVSFTVDGHPGTTFNGTVVRINPMANGGARTITLYALVNNPAGELKGGMFASGHVIAEAGKADVIRVPQAAVRRINGKDHVWLVRNNTLALQAVELGIRDSASGLVEVRNGLSSGEQVILTEIGNREPGMPVTIADVR